MCISEILTEHKIYFRDNIAAKLAKVNFKENYESMIDYNAILFPLGCWFEFLGSGIKKIDRLSEFFGNALVIKKAENVSRFHMVPIRKRKIEEEIFRRDKILKDSEGCLFTYYQYKFQKKIARPSHEEDNEERR